MQEHELTECGYVQCWVARLELLPYSLKNQCDLDHLLERNEKYHGDRFGEIKERDRAELRERGYTIEEKEGK